MCTQSESRGIRAEPTLVKTGPIFRPSFSVGKEQGNAGVPVAGGYGSAGAPCLWESGGSSEKRALGPRWSVRSYRTLTAAILHGEGEQQVLNPGLA